MLIYKFRQDLHTCWESVNALVFVGHPVTRLYPWTTIHLKNIYSSPMVQDDDTGARVFCVVLVSVVVVLLVKVMLPVYICSYVCLCPARYVF